MASTPEAFFAESLMEPEPLSPSIFVVDLPPTPDADTHNTHAEGQHVSNELALSYISHMLMADDMDGQHLRQYSDDHPALRQVERPFAQILSSTSLGRGGDQGTINKGNAEIIDEMMLRGYETCIQDMGKLRIAMANEANQNGSSKARSDDAVDLLTLLMRCAQAVDDNDYTSAGDLLKKVKQHASATGDATQWLAQCFAKGLEVRLAGMGSKLYYEMLMEERPSVLELLRAYKIYMAACCFNKVPLVFNIMTILHATAGKSKLHIVDYGLDYGFRWAGLLRFLSEREGGPPEVVKITAIGNPAGAGPGPYQADQIEEAGRQLSDCARVFGLPSFKFHVILANWEQVCIDDLNKDTDEVLVVNDLFSFTTLMEESVCIDALSPRDIVLKNIRNMKPDVFIQGILNCLHGVSFLTRFRETLFYYSAMFDVLDATMPIGSKQRQILEQHVLGPCALNVIACEGSDRMHRSDTYKQWKLRNKRAGLRLLPLDPEIVKKIRDEVKRHYYHKDFLITEDHQWLLHGWKGRILYGHSTWVADDALSP